MSFDGCHTPVAMQVQQSPTNTMCCYVSRLVSDIEKLTVCSVVCARGQAFADQVCQAIPSAAGRHAAFSKLREDEARVVYTMRYIRYLPASGS